MWWSEQRDNIRLYSFEQVLALMEKEYVFFEVRNSNKLDKFNAPAY
jgi:hypothetical protein